MTQIGTTAAEAEIRADPEILRRNLEVIAARQPEVARAIASAGASGAVFARADDGAATGELDGRALASRRRPLDEAARLAGTVDLTAAGVVVCLGFGLGHHLAALAERARGTTGLVVFEPDVELLRAAMERVDHAGWIAETQLRIALSHEDVGATTQLLRGLEGPLAVGVALLEHPASRARLTHASARFHQTFQQAFAATRTHIITTMVQTDTTVRNELMNVGSYARWPGIAELEGIAAGRPAVLVAAGPSLERNLDVLATPGVRERCVIIAVQTVLRTMLDRGVRPHFVTAIDYHEISRRFYEGLRAEDVEGVTLIAEARVNAAVLDAWPGAVRMPEDAFLAEVLAWGDRPARGALAQAATVAHLSYYLARYLGADPVVMIGQDLAFTDGQYYANDAAIHDVWAGELNAFNTLERMEWERIVRFRGHLYEGVDHLGRRVYLDDQMATYLAQFERDFAPDVEAGRMVIDATEGGVAKRGAVAMPLVEALDRHAPPTMPEMAPMPIPAPREDPAVVAEVRGRLRSVRADERRIARGAREGRDLLRKMMRDQRDVARVNRLIGRINEIRDEAQSLRPAFGLLMRLNQLGALKRFRADRLIRLAEGLDPFERQRLQIERDEVNLRWTEDLAELLAELLEVADATFDGGAKRTRDAAAPAIDAGGDDAPAAGVRAVACVPMDAAALERAARDAGGRPALARTLDRLAASGRVDAAVIAAEDADAARGLVASIDAPIEVGVVARAPDADRARAIAAARAPAGSSWRGGIAGLTVFDEVFDPPCALAALEAAGADAVVVVGGDWVGLDPELTAEVIDRHAEQPLASPLAFSQAPPGVAPCVLGRGLVEELAGAGDDAARFSTIGAALAYLPMRPRTDAIAKPGCVQVAPEVRDALVRTIADGARAIPEGRSAPEAWRRLGDEPPAGPAHLTLELTTRRPARGDRFPFAGEPARGELDPGLARRVLRSAVELEPRVSVTLAGLGDPLEHPAWCEIVAAAREAGVRSVHVRTDLLCDAGAAARLLDSGAGVVSVDLLAHRAETYLAIAGVDGYARAVENLDAMLRARGERGPWGLPWIVPRITRRDAVYDELEVFYDKWLLVAGAAAIDPLPAPIPGERIEPMPRPASVVRRDALERLTVLSDGRVVCGDLDLEGAGAVGSARDEPLAGLWRRVLDRRLERIRSGGRTHPDLSVIW
jgi:hypothetical protein